MLTRCVKIIGLIAALSVFSGCGILPAQRETMLDKNWGSSFESARDNQILNREAGKNLDPVVGLDGEASVITMERYREGFKKQPSKEKNDITIKMK